MSAIQIGGWAWRSDIPNTQLNVHLYIRKTIETTSKIIGTLASSYRSDLANLGYGNGNHGFVHAMDWSTLPEELLTVEVYAVDGSGHHPRIYVGTYENRKPIYLLGATDEDGTYYSDWMTSTVRDYCYDIGCSECIKWTGFNNNAAMSAIANSSVCVIDTHGGPDGISCYYQGEKTDLTSSMITNDTTRDYSTTRFVLLLACSCGGQTDDNSVNFVNALHNKGVQTVLGFSTEIFSVVVDAEIEELIIDQGACLWAKYFLEFLGQGYTIIAAYEDALGLVFEDCGETYGLENKVFAGNQNQVVKH